MSETRRIPLDRRVLVVREERIDLRPERGAVIFPLAGLLISAAIFASIVLFAGDLSATALVLILLPGLILAPFSAMGLVYSVIGAAVVIEKGKKSVCFQQGVLGLGIGTMDLVPFWKIDHIVVEDFEQGIAAPGPHPLDFRAWDIVLVKVSGKRLPIAQALEEQVGRTKGLSAMRLETQVQTGSSLIGREISGIDKNSNDATGIVLRVIVRDGETFLELANKQRVPLANVLDVVEPAVVAAP